MSSLKNFTGDIEEEEEEESDNYDNNTYNDTENNNDTATDPDINNNNKNGTRFICLNHGDSLILKFNYLLLLILLFF